MPTNWNSDYDRNLEKFKEKLIRLPRRIYPQVGETGMLEAQSIKDKLPMCKVTSQVQWESTPYTSGYRWC